MRWILPIAAFLSLAGIAAAEGSRGYFFVAPGGASALGTTRSMYYIGGGGELRLPAGVGAGVEAQGVVPSTGAGRGSFGIFSINGYYHPIELWRRTTNWDPYGTVGYSLAFRTDTANLWNFGVGTNYWFRENLALMVEFRDHPWKRGVVRVHYWGFRFGLSWR